MLKLSNCEQVKHAIPNHANGTRTVNGPKAWLKASRALRSIFGCCRLAASAGISHEPAARILGRPKKLRQHVGLVHRWGVQSCVAQVQVIVHIERNTSFFQPSPPPIFRARFKHTNMSLAPPFTEETARAKVKKAQDLWNAQYED